MADKLLEVNGLKRYFNTKEGQLHAVDNIHFSINKGETLGLVGESGCGKSTTGRLVLRLIPPTDGEIKFEGQDIKKFDKKAIHKFRRDAQIVFQDPFSSLNPRMNVKNIISEPFEIHNIRENTKTRVSELMDLVGLSSRLLNAYPHELDGGRRQRVGIARALALNPKFIVLDEPVSSLDVSIQAQILNLLDDLQDELDLTYLFIAHDLSVVKHISDKVAVMYVGKMVEMTDYSAIFKNPKHPYTKALISAIPIPSIEVEQRRIILEGDVPSPVNPGKGCRFYSRCFERKDICKEQEPELNHVEGHGLVACHNV
ncbi:ABC transporter ATP-binding protein [Natranaerobius trueperi]|uniref:Peptide ABC transporter ATP-binding protein n=1 Tax=Natranaerobius trueperi TaxID=759412 RepID=A0A226C1G1_9FIRM|nr:ABC transporter ATP-binding protein [Natranaerobius trueperi]OWZ85015.1 peptide ABC transporter ATP-binding protein [Natranaerobius trueperi]